MNNIQDNSVVDLLPESLKVDPFIVALAEAVEMELKEAYREAEAMSNFWDVDRLPEPLLDYMAHQKHVDFYDFNMPIETKRNLIKNSDYLHRIKGTPAAINFLLETVFGDGIVEEWFEYGGEPYHFRVLTSNPSSTQEKAEEFIKSVNSVKNMRSRLDSVILIQSEQMNIYWGGVVHIGSIEKYK